MENRERGGKEMNGWITWTAGALFTVGVTTSPNYVGLLASGDFWEGLAIYFIWPFILGLHFAG